MKRSGAALGLARWSAEHPWRAMAAWLVLVVACLVLGSTVGTKSLSDAQSGSGESGRAARVVEAANYPTTVTEDVLIQSPSGSLDQDAADAAVRDLRTTYAGVAGIESVGEPVTSADGRSVLVPVTMAPGGASGNDAVTIAAENVPAMIAATATVQAEHPELVIEQVGDASLEASLGRQIGHDFRRAEMLSLPLTLIILIVAFGALFAAGVPVLLALTAVAGAIGLSAVVSHLTPITDILSSVILLIGMAVGVDYSLFYVRRAREERAKGASTLDSVEIAAATSGRAVLVSAVAVTIAMSGMFLSGNAVFVSFAAGTILVVVMAAVGSLTVLPAILAKLGDRIDRPRVPFLHRLRRPVGEPPRMWPGLMRVVLARPAVSLVIGVGALLALAAPAVSMNLRDTGPDDLPRSIAELRTYDRLVAAFPQEGTTHTVVVSSTAPLDRDAVAAAATDLGKASVATGLFAPGDWKPKFSPDGAVATIDYPLAYSSEDPRAAASLTDLRTSLLPTSFADLEAHGVTAAVTGEVADNADFTHQLVHRLPLVIGFVLVLTFLVLLLAFRSVVIAATAIGLNLLSVAAAYGLLVLVFQHHWAEGLLAFHSNGAVLSWLPLFLFVVLFGLSMDYHVFVVSRIREAKLRGLSTKDAVAEGVTRSAGVVTSAAIVMVGVFGIFATLSILDFKQMGVGLAAAVLIDATIVRALLLPSAMALLGHWNWWLPASWERLPHLEGTPVAESTTAPVEPARSEERVPAGV